MKGVKKRGLWAMWIGFILIFFTFIPGLAGVNVIAIVLQIAGWVIFTVGAIVRGKQKKEQRKLEQAMYGWANERYGRRASKKTVSSQPPARTVQAQQAPQPRPVKQQPPEQYSFRVAGLYYRRNAIPSIASKNPEYCMTASEMQFENVMENRRIYEYLQILEAPQLAHDPDNPHDPNAIGVYIGGWFVGYVPKEETRAVAPIIAGKYRASARLSGGRWKCLHDDGHVSHGEMNLRIDVSLYYR